MRNLTLLIALCSLILQSCVVRPISYHPNGGVIIRRSSHRPIVKLRKSNRTYWTPAPVKPRNR